jgi:hypothetical protein
LEKSARQALTPMMSGFCLTISRKRSVVDDVDAAELFAAVRAEVVDHVE